MESWLCSLTYQLSWILGLHDIYKQWQLNGANTGGFSHAGAGTLQGMNTGTPQGIDTGTLHGIDTGTLYTDSEREEENLVKILGTQAWLVGRKKNNKAKQTKAK